VLFCVRVFITRVSASRTRMTVACLYQSVTNLCVESCSNLLAFRGVQFTRNRHVLSTCSWYLNDQYDRWWYFKIVRTIKIKLKRNSFKTVLKLFLFVSSKTKRYGPWNVLAILASHCRYPLFARQTRCGAGRWRLR